MDKLCRRDNNLLVFREFISYAVILLVLTATTLSRSQNIEPWPDNIFRHQPRNTTAMEGETVKFNCSSTNNDLTAFWIIDGSEYSWRDFRLTRTYTFNLQDNSLTINNVTKSLDGTSFQCIIDRHASDIGYLKVISNEKFTNYTSPPPLSTSDNIMNSMPLVENTSFTILFEDSTRLNDTKTACWIIVAVTVTTVVIILIILATILTVLVCLIIKRHHNTVSEGKSQQETFTMVTNDLYGVRNQC